MNTSRCLSALCAVALIAGSFALVACGSDDNDKSSSSSGGGSASVDTAAAKQTLAPYTGKASPFPVEEPLTKKPGPDSTFAYLQCVTPICGLLVGILQPATKTLGVKFTPTKAGASADGEGAAMDTIISTKPAAVLVPAIEPAPISTQLKKLAGSNVPVSSVGIMNAGKFSIPANMFGNQTSVESGKILASWVVVHKGSKANAVFYTVPELSFAKIQENAFKTEMSKLCPDCKVRVIDIPIASLGNTAPSKAVSDLQAHPDTNVAVYSTMDATIGLSSQLKTAGLTDKVAVTGFAPGPATLAEIQAGKLASGLGLDFAVQSWTQVDSAARLATGEPVTPLEKAGATPMQMLDAAALKGVPVKQGWTGYPDFPARFGKLWAGAKAQ